MHLIMEASHPWKNRRTAHTWSWFVFFAAPIVLCFRVMEKNSLSPATAGTKVRSDPLQQKLAAANGISSNPPSIMSRAPPPSGPLDWCIAVISLFLSLVVFPWIYFWLVINTCQQLQIEGLAETVYRFNQVYSMRPLLQLKVRLAPKCTLADSIIGIIRMQHTGGI